MTDAVTDVSKPPSSGHVLERMESFSEALQDQGAPESEFVWELKTEEEAAEILLAMAAALALVVRDPDYRDKHGRRTVKDFCRLYRRNVSQRTALSYIRTLDVTDELSIYGLKIVPAPFLQLAQ